MAIKCHAPRFVDGQLQWIQVNGKDQPTRLGKVAWLVQQNSRSHGQVSGEEEHGLHFRPGGCFLEGRLQYRASVCPSE